MSEVFALSASLTLDTGAFEAAVAQAEAQAASLEASLSLMMSAISSAMASLSALNSAQAQAAAGANETGGALSTAVANAFRGVTVQMNGETVGRLVAPSVNREIGLMAQRRRFG